MVRRQPWTSDSCADRDRAIVLSGFSNYGALLLLPLYFQGVRGMTALQAGLLLGTLPLARLGAQTGIVPLSLVLVLRGFGLGGVVIPIMACAYRDLDSTGIPHGSTLVRIAMQLGGAFGTAALAVILHAGMRSHPSGIAGQISAFDAAFAWTAAFTALAMVCAAFLPGGRGQALGAEAA